MTSRDQLQETLCNRLFWHTAERDDAKVAQPDEPKIKQASYIVFGRNRMFRLS